jgi:hypothetical protein
VPRKIGAVLMLIVLIVFGVAVIALASVVLLRPRQATEARKVRDLLSERGEREVYEKLYGKRSTTVSAPVPVERPPEADVDRVSEQQDRSG